MFEWNTFLLGGGIGLTSAIIGGMVEYQISSRSETANGRLPGCMLLVTGGLGFTGIVVTLFSWFVGRDFTRPIVAGLGVGLGFFLGFLLLMVIWLLFFGQKMPPPE